MTGGLLQLSAIGKQNILLNLKPEVTYFKSVYKRHSNFAIEAIEQRFVEDVNFGRRVTCEISRKADLMGSVYFHFRLPALTVPAGSTYVGWTNSLGYAIIKYVDFEVGGLRMDRQYGLWMEIWDELTTPEDKRAGVNLAIGKFDVITQLETNATDETEYYVPLNFWFTRNPGLYLPLVALQYHSVKFIFELRPFSECITFDGPDAPDSVDIIDGSLIVDYIYLDKPERKRFIKENHLYLIDQVQFLEKDNVPAGTTIHKTRLSDFNHPVKEINWVFVETESEDNNDWFNFARRSDIENLMAFAQLKFENEDRFEKRREDYFRLIQNLQHHTRIPIKYLYTYSFGLFPERKSPSGATNFSMFDNVDMLFDMNTSNPETHMYMFATNWNMFIVSNGMGALAYND